MHLAKSFARSLARSPAAGALLVFFLALIPRVLGLGRFVTFDEPVWVFRTLVFWRAVADGRWADTVVSAHPGVLTMWLGGAGLALQSSFDPTALDRAWALAAVLPGLRATDDAALRALGPLLAAATWPVAAAQALAIALCYVLAARAFGRAVALVFAGLLALDPFAIGLARVLHVDGLQALCGAVALLAAAAYTRTGARRYVALSGVAAALACLAKMPAAAMVVWSLPLVMVRGPRSRGRLADGGLWTAAAGLTALCLWPALWVEPVGTLAMVRSGGERFAERAIDTAHFFLGQVVEAPGPLFYPVAGFLRANPWLVLGLLLAPLLWRWGRRRERRAWLGAVLLAMGYIALLSLSPKKFDRYLLPTWPLWALAAALGYRAAVRWRRWPIPRAALAGLVALVIQLAVLASIHPYSLAWFSPLAGGSRAGLAALPVGWGEGLDQVAAFGRAEASAGAAGTPFLMTSAIPGLAPLVDAPVLALEQANLPRADYIVRYIADTQAPVPEWLTPTLASAPVFTATIRGQPYAWVHRNVEMEMLADRMRADPAPSIIARGGDYLLGRTKGTGLPYWDDGVDRAMASLTIPELWLAIQPLSPTPAQVAADLWMATHAHRLARIETPHTVLTRYRVAEDGAGSPAPHAIRGAGFGDHARIQGATWSAGPLAGTRALGLRIDWAGLATEEADLTAFLHLTDASGRLWGQVDQPIAAFADDPLWGPMLDYDPFQPDRPRSRLPFDVADALDTGRQDLLLYPWPGTPPGRYQTWLGVYRNDDGMRLPIRELAPGLNVDGDRVLLGEVTVERPAVQPEIEDLAIPIPLNTPMGPLRLLGAALPETPRRVGEVAQVSLFWEVEGQVATGDDQALDTGALRLDTGAIRLDLVADYPPEGSAPRRWPVLAEPLCAAPCAWRPGDRLRTQLGVRIPDDLPPGRYGLEAGLSTGDGLSTRLGEIEVGAAQP